ncbi:hypothetical protein [Fictibacillus halophilus]
MTPFLCNGVFLAAAAAPPPWLPFSIQKKPAAKSWLQLIYELTELASP